MEVHHHAHTSRKKWTHYIWEFLMLFLAVFCGFLAENQREHYVEHQREKQYIVSMIEDLGTDTSNISNLIYRFEKKESLFDSVILGFKDGFRNYKQEWAQQFLRSFRGGFPDFYPTDRTIQQLKNSGGLRLTGDISSWEREIQKADSLRNQLIQQPETRDNKLIYRLASDLNYNNTFAYHDRTIGQLKYAGNFRLTIALDNAEKLMMLLKKEYQLK